MKMLGGPSKRVTMAQVAEHAGVAVGTVSRVLNNTPGITSRNRERVLAAVAGLKYNPPPTIFGQRRKRHKQAKQILLSIAYEGGLRWIMDTCPVYGYVLHGIESALSQANYPLQIRNFRPATGEDAKFSERVKKPDGIIFFGMGTTAEQPSEWKGCPVIKVMGEAAPSWAEHVTCNSITIGRMTAEYLLERGHQSIGVVAVREGLSIRLDTFMSRCRESGVDPILFDGAGLIQRDAVHNAAKMEVVESLVERMCELPRRPTGLYCSGDMLLPALSQALFNKGIIPGKDLDIISVNNERQYLSSLPFRPAVVDIQAEEIGRKAVARLLWRIANPDEIFVSQMVEPKLIRPVP